MNVAPIHLKVVLGLLLDWIMVVDPLNGTKSGKREVISTIPAAGQPQPLQFQRQCRQSIQKRNKVTNDEVDKRAKNHVTYAQPEIVQASENPEYDESAAKNAAASEPQFPGKLRMFNVWITYLDK